jgi:hypothetical protein
VNTASFEKGLIDTTLSIEGCQAACFEDDAETGESLSFLFGEDEPRQEPRIQGTRRQAVVSTAKSCRVINGCFLFKNYIMIQNRY